MKQIKRINQALLFLFLFALLIPLASAKITVDVDMRDSFSLGEKISFDYSIFSDSAAEVIFTPYIECPKAPLAPTYNEIINLAAGGIYSGTYSGSVVYEFIEPQECVAFIQVKAPESVREEKTFRIDVEPSFDFTVFACTDKACIDKSTVFVLGETVYFGFKSEIAGSIVSAELITPSGTKRQITLPGPMVTKTVGNYELRATASVESYKTIEETFNFSVIEKHAEIPSASQCNANGTCDLGENPQNCPQDCPLEGAGVVEQFGEPAEPAGFDWLLVIGIVVLVAVLAFAYFKVYKPRREM